eukprot:TRINITY_DN3102_c0_g2_i1.p1 TRINITY_DN3102_c0_g2~~TRINITY_DN3102_c0_g2_i1.p1  ORF type:complete len:453 (-),score=93.22 TRINITY_DN3102_c0_g2_i1:80-1438(-)
MELECTICNRDYASLLEEKVEPKALPCGHSLCSKCLDEIEFQRKLISCPFRCAGTVARASNLRTNYLAVELLKALSLSFSQGQEFHDGDEAKIADINFSQPSSLCENRCERTASLMCMQCSCLYCTQCYDDVHHFPALRNHSARPSTRKLLFPVCELHHEPRKFYCETDNELICRDCFDALYVGQHKGHNVTPASLVVNSKFEDTQNKVKKQLKAWESQEQTAELVLECVEASRKAFIESCQKILVAFKTLQRSLRVWKSRMQATRKQTAKYLDRPTPSAEECLTFLQTEIPLVENILQSVCDSEGAQVLKVFASVARPTLENMGVQLDEVGKVKMDVICASRSSIKLKGSLSKKGKVIIRGVSESGTVTCLKGNEDFDVEFTPAAEAKFELTVEDNNWVIRYNISKNVKAVCCVKFGGVLLEGSPLVVYRPKQSDVRSAPNGEQDFFCENP